MNQDVYQLTRILASLLMQKSIRICTAESCTGGLIAKTFTDLAGSSEWFDRSFVTYSNQSKIDMLGIQSSTLNKFGAVSEDIAREMVAGALKFSEAQLAVSVTGIAGPGGGSDDKPVGTVCFGFALKGKTASEKIWTEKKWFNGEREQVREASLLFVLNRLNEVIISN